MIDVRRAGDNRWHVAVNLTGVYIRLHAGANGETISIRDAREIAEAILELTDDNDG